MLMRRPKSSRLLSKGNSKDDAEVVQSSTTSLPKSKKSFRKHFSHSHLPTSQCRRSWPWEVSVLAEREAADTGPGQQGDQRQVRRAPGEESHGRRPAGRLDSRQERSVSLH